MNQLGGVGAGGIPGRSYAFASTADGTHKHFYCGHPFGFKYKNNKHIIYPKRDKTFIYNLPEYFYINLNNNNNKCNDLITNLVLLQGKSYSINTVNDLVVNFTITKLCGNIIKDRPTYYYYNISSVSVNNKNVQTITVIRNDIKIKQISSDNVSHNLNATNFTISLV